MGWMSLQSSWAQPQWLLSWVWQRNGPVHEILGFPLPPSPQVQAWLVLQVAPVPNVVGQLVQLKLQCVSSSSRQPLLHETTPSEPTGCVVTQVHAPPAEHVASGPKVGVAPEWQLLQGTPQWVAEL